MKRVKRRAKFLIAVCGNVVQGMTFFGPFPNVEAASEFIAKRPNDEWWIAPLVLPA